MNSDTAIHPFEIEIRDEELEDFRERLARSRWPHALEGAGWERGVPQDYLEGLAAYWRDGFDWRAQERRLNAFPQFLTTIDGQTIHFLHVRSAEPDALPLIVTHGYPGSVVEFVDVIGPLSDPPAHGGDPADAFHLVVPSLPGFGFSAPLADTGWDMARTARAWVELMHRLGYERYVAQGGDIGAGITGTLGALDPEGVIAAHVNSDPLATALIGESIGIDLQAFAASEELGARARTHRVPRSLRRRGQGLPAAAVDPPADDRLRPHRLTGRAAGVDRREVQGVDRPRRRASGASRRPRPAARERQPLLVHTHRRLRRQLPLRGGALDRVARADGDAAGMGGVRGRRDRPTAARPRGANRALVGVPAGWPLRRDGGTRPARRRPTEVLPHLQVSRGCGATLAWRALNRETGAADQGAALGTGGST